ncbi:cell surface A33 antigen isoform X2 [Ornithorhynchus anatinus]|uniref:cell surface A33 antigen isoform X2 n=1 Tax=Ornithorhynchus anatinus TaxID=9258 RepID=UPI0010A93401|nr:cell surface A33 antigen isoform X2 [Ornithorhynchus anatinus]
MSSKNIPEPRQPACRSARAIHVDTPVKLVKAARGGSADLPCTFQTSADKLYGFIKWDKPLENPSEKVIIWTFHPESSNFGPKFLNRVNFTGNSKNEASIRIGPLNMEDNGTYECSLSLFGDLDGQDQAKMELIVLVPPSKPDCAIQGEAVLGNDVELTCHSREGSPAPKYTWKSFNILNEPRPITGPTTGQSISLKNISTETSGYFICTATNEVGDEFCNITLAVRPPSMNIALYAGIAGGMVAALIVLGVIIYCCCCRGGKEEDQRPSRDGYREPPQRFEQMRRDEGSRDDDDQRWN